MTLIEDMSETQRQSWMTLIVDGTVYLWFVGKMTAGFGSNVRVLDIEPSGLVKLYISVIVMTIILHIIIAGVFAARRAKDHSEAKDERDILIERRGAAVGYGFLVVALNILIFQYLAENSLDAYVAPFSLGTVSHMFFVLLSLAFVADIIKNAVMIFAYRGE